MEKSKCEVIMADRFNLAAFLAAFIVVFVLICGVAGIALGVWAIFYWHLFWQALATFCSVVTVAAIVIGISYARHS
jgi:predicted cation transporter